MRTAFVRCGVRVTLETARRRGRCRSTRWRWSSATRAPLASRATLGTARQAGPPSASGRIGGRRAPSTAAWSGPSLLLRARGRALEAVRAGARVRRAARFAQLVAGAGEGSSRTHLVLMSGASLGGRFWNPVATKNGRPFPETIGAAVIISKRPRRLLETLPTDRVPGKFYGRRRLMAAEGMGGRGEAACSSPKKTNQPGMDGWMGSSNRVGYS